MGCLTSQQRLLKEERGVLLQHSKWPDMGLFDRASVWSSGTGATSLCMDMLDADGPFDIIAGPRRSEARVLQQSKSKFGLQHVAAAL